MDLSLTLTTMTKNVAAQSVNTVYNIQSAMQKHPYVTALIGTATAAGATAAFITGAPFIGCAIVLSPVAGAVIGDLTHEAPLEGAALGLIAASGGGYIYASAVTAAKTKIMSVFMLDVCAHSVADTVVNAVPSALAATTKAAALAAAELVAIAGVASLAIARADTMCGEELCKALGLEDTGCVTTVSGAHYLTNSCINMIVGIVANNTSTADVAHDPL